ncbi:MAG: hypothetical protein ACRDZV_16825 [Acidimicrobiia bacterium]
MSGASDGDAPGTGPSPADVGALRAEVAELRARLDRRETWRARRRRGRRWSVGLLVVLFAIGAVGSLVGVWARQTALKTESFVRAVEPLPRDPKVSRALATFMVDELFTELDIDRRAEEALPDNLQFLIGPLDGIVRDYTRDAVANVLRSDRFDRLWVSAVRTTHRIAVQVLRGDNPPGLIDEDGEVVLDLLPVIHDVLQVVVNEGPGFLGDVELPDLDSDATRREIRRELSSRFDVDLPEDFGQIVIFDEDQLSAAQHAVKLADRFVIAAVVITVLLGAGAILASVDRRRTILQLGIATSVATFFVFTVLRVVADDLADLVEEGDNRAAARAAAEIVSRGLRDRAWYLLIGGLVVAAVAYLVGPSRGAVWTRRRARTAGSRIGEGTVAFPTTSAGRWVTTNVDGMRVAGVVIAALVLIVLDVSWMHLLVALILLGAYQVALSWVVRASATT